MNMAQKEQPARKGKAEVSRLQSLCALLGGAITLAAVAILARAAFTELTPADLSVHYDAARPSASGWVVEVSVTNHGDLTAAAVDIEGDAGGRQATATLDYVPGHGSKKASLVFAGSDRPEPRLRVLGWSAP